MKIEHIAMYVNDLEAARDFFIKYFVYQIYFLSLKINRHIVHLNL